MKTIRSFLPILLFAVFAGCGGTEMVSSWHGTQRSSVDSAASKNPLTVGDARTTIRTQNDNEYLYVTFRTSNRDLQRLIFREGIRWWFDRMGGDKKIFGVKYPLPGTMRARNSENEGDEMNPPGQPGEDHREGAQMDPANRRGLDEPRMRPGEWNQAVDMELYVNGEESAQHITTVNSGGLTARFRVSRDTMYYELKVPLQETATHMFAIGAKAGEKIGVVAETVMEKNPEGLFHARPEGGAGGGGEQGGMGGMGGGGRRGRGGAGGGERGGRGEGEGGRSASRGDQISTAFHVTLATQ